VRDVEQWYMSDITEAFESCIILHNMIAEERRDQDEEERHNWYDFNNNDGEYNYNAPINPAEKIWRGNMQRQNYTLGYRNFFIMV
jgi:hypothetical protein